MNCGRHRRVSGRADARVPGRRSGPTGEGRWWDPADQELAERPLLGAGDFGPGWTDAAMPNNVERLDPLGDDPGSDAVRRTRTTRRLTALDEGRAWRQRTHGSLAVLRVEVFADLDEEGHRTAWRRYGEASLVATWRARWTERDRRPGWIEARWVDTAALPDLFARADRPATSTDHGSSRPPGEAIDWLRIEDHTDPRDESRVTVYEHFTIWAGRSHATFTVRHDLDVDVHVAPVAATVLARLAALR